MEADRHLQDCLRRPVLWLLAAVVSWALLGAARQALPAGIGPDGTGTYANAKWDGQPVMTVVDREPSTAQMLERWNNEPPQTFSASWNGYLSIIRPGLYFFATTSEDRSRLYIDNEIVVDNTGGHVNGQAGSIRLDRGPHRVVLEYAHVAGAPRHEMGVGVRRRQRQGVQGRAALGAVATAARLRDGHRRPHRRGAARSLEDSDRARGCLVCARLADSPARRLGRVVGGATAAIRRRFTLC